MPEFLKALALSLTLLAATDASVVAAENAFGGPWPARAPDSQPVEGELWGTLDNGLRYAIVPAATRGNEVSLRLMVAAGRANEPKGKAGLSHVVADAMLEGTKGFSREEIAAFQLANGMRLYASNRAVVDMEHTVFRMDLLEPQADAVGEGLAFLGDVASAPQFEAESLSRLKQAIEHRAGQSYGKYFPEQARLEEILFRSSLYGQLGDTRVKGEVGSVTVGDVQSYHESWYKPNRMVLVVSGAINPESVHAKVTSIFGQMAPGEKRQGMGRPTGRLREKGEIDSEDSNDVFGRLTITNAMELKNRYDPETEKRMIVLDFLGRYAQRLASNADRMGDTSISILGDFVAVRIDRRGPFLSMLDYLLQSDKAMHQLVELGIPSDELEKAKAEYLRLRDSYDAMLSTREYPGVLADRVVQSVSKKVPFRRGDELASLLQAVIGSLGREEATQLNRSVFQIKELNYLVELPAGVGLSAKTISKRMKGMRKGYDFTWAQTGEVGQDLQLGAGFASSGMVDSTKLLEFGEYSVLQYAFTNRVRLNLVRATAFPGRMQIHLAMGNGMTDMENPSPAFGALVGALLAKTKVGSGVQAVAMRELLTTKGLSNVYAGVDLGQLYWSAEASSDEELAAFLSGVLVWMVASDLKEEDFDDEKEAMLSSLGNGSSGGGLVELESALYGEDLRLRGYVTKDALEAITYSDLKAWLTAMRERGYIEITVVGDASPRTLLRDARKTFGSAPERKGKVVQPRHAKPADWKDAGIVERTEKLSFDTGYVTMVFPAVEELACSNKYRQAVLRELMLEHGKRALADDPSLAESFEVSVEGKEMAPGSDALKLQVRSPADQATRAKERLMEVAETFATSLDGRLLEAAKRSVWIDLRWTTRNLGGLVALFNQSQGRPNALECALNVYRNGLSGNLDTYRTLASEQFSAANVRGAVLMPEK